MSDGRVMWGEIIRENKDGTILEYEDGSRMYLRRPFIARLLWILLRRKDYDARAAQ